MAIAKMFLLQDPVDGVAVHFTVPGDPVTKARARFARTRNGGVHSYTPETTKQGMSHVAAQYRRARGAGAPGTKGFGVHMEFYVKTNQRRDVDNYVKLIFDGLNGVAWVDDSQVTEMSAKVVRVTENPRSEVHVYPTEDLPDPRSRTCVRCNERFRVYSTTTAKKYCSDDCRYAAVRERRAKTCRTCGSTFHPKPNSPAEYCSMPCWSEDNTITRPCEGCGVSVTRPQSQTKARTWCTQKCRIDTKTHCKRGHEYVPGNTYVHPDGRRACRTCRTEDSRRRRATKKEST